MLGSSGLFGAIPLFGGTILISLIALLIAVPIGLMTAIYLSEYATTKVRAFTKPMLEILSGIPTAAVTVEFWFRYCFRKRFRCWCCYGHYDNTISILFI